jgi:hypothetical protein
MYSRLLFRFFALNSADLITSFGAALIASAHIGSWATDSIEGLSTSNFGTVMALPLWRLPNHSLNSSKNSLFMPAQCQALSTGKFGYLCLYLSLHDKNSTTSSFMLAACFMVGTLKNVNLQVLAGTVVIRQHLNPELKSPKTIACQAV